MVLSPLSWNNGVKLTDRLGENKANMHFTNLFIPTKATEHEMHPLPHDNKSETTVFTGLIRKPPRSLKAGRRKIEGAEGKAMLCKCQENILIFASTTKEKKSAQFIHGLVRNDKRLPIKSYTYCSGLGRFMGGFCASVIFNYCSASIILILNHERHALMQATA